MNNHYKFPSIESFHNVRKSVKRCEAYDPITYRGKVKLHGTNAGVVVTPDGDVYAQSRNHVITSQDDNMGFAAWVESTKEFWKLLAGFNTIVFFGEWFGEGIMKGTAASQVKSKHFGIFAVLTHSLEMMVWEPQFIETYILDNAGLDDIPLNVWVIPYVGEEFTVDFADETSLQSAIDYANQQVKQVEECDPFISQKFGIDGVGEGIVYAPVHNKSRNTFSFYTFKAKGDKHKVTKSKNAVQMDPEKAESIRAFVDLVLTPARLQQGVDEAANGEFDKRHIGPFLQWIGGDVKKECQSELEASGLDFKDVGKAIQHTARVWYQGQC